jgi:hypothetical protein
MNLSDLIAREAIRDTVARYAHCGDSGRFDEMAQLFDEEGVLEIDGREANRGRPAILRFLGETRQTLGTAVPGAFIRHHVSNLVIDLEGADEARAASYFFVVTHRGPDHWGRYRDRFVRRGERWLFAHRRVRLDGRNQF